MVKFNILISMTLARASTCVSFNILPFLAGNVSHGDLIKTKPTLVCPVDVSDNFPLLESFCRTSTCPLFWAMFCHITETNFSYRFKSYNMVEVLFINIHDKVPRISQPSYCPLSLQLCRLKVLFLVQVCQFDYYNDCHGTIVLFAY